MSPTSATSRSLLYPAPLGAASMDAGSLSRRRQSPASYGQLSDADKTTAAERVVTFLRKRHPTKTADCVAADTGVNRDTIQKWLDRGSLPNAAAMLALVATYGPDFLCAAMHTPPAWLSRAASEDRLSKIEAQIAALEAERLLLAGR